MPWTAFVDIELEEELNKINSNNNVEDKFPEHAFFALCARSGITIEHLKLFTYVDIMKMLISFIDTSENKQSNIKIATQSDIDRLLK